MSNKRTFLHTLLVRSTEIEQVLKTGEMELLLEIWGGSIREPVTIPGHPG